jgi:acetylornithine deacetylase/succinyl-diaminopimelate desuccinylase-like protein
MADFIADRHLDSGWLAERDSAVPWNSVGEESVDLLRQYIRFPTVNDPDSLKREQTELSPWLAGREAEAAQWLGGYLRSEGIATELLESAPGRINLVARLSGTGRGGAVTLLSHSDVVPIRRDEWEDGIDPFAATLRDGYLYGRGTLDLKALGIAHLMTLVLLSRLKVPLQRDVVLLIVADEETGGRFGAEWLLHQRPELLSTQVVLGEGAYSPKGLLPRVGTVQAIAVAEKGYLELELLAEDQSHHASMPDPNDAPARLIRALARILEINDNVRVIPSSKVLLKHLANSATGAHRILLRWPSLAARLAPRHLTSSSIVGAMLKDTIAVTVLESGQKSNVVPGLARAVLSIRFLPGTDPETLTAKIRRAADGLGINIRRLKYKPANASDFDSPQFKALVRHAAAEEPDTLVTPILSPGASDCRFWRRANVNCYGWIPFVISGSDLHGVHGPNERISIAAFQRGLRSMYHAVAEMATSL